jgi:hypothetical protein
VVFQYVILLRRPVFLFKNSLKDKGGESMMVGLDSLFSRAGWSGGQKHAECTFKKKRINLMGLPD